MVHRIRLTSAWTVLSDRSGEIVWRRVFHCPTGLETRSQVWLVIEGPRQPQCVRLNGDRLFDAGAPPETPHKSPLRLEIQTRLKPTKNVLEITFPGHGQFSELDHQMDGQLLQPIPMEVYLEIQDSESKN
ncbi:MAG: hypothetical protein WBH86_09750 [Thermogutta sp.]|nr:hypothetical protein [Thermogutta sp.]HPU05040.1 hypothetical protein [Thermogutta sp.]